MQHLNMLGRRRKYASSQSSYIGRFYGLLLMARYDGPGRQFICLQKYSSY